MTIKKYTRLDKIDFESLWESNRHIFYSIHTKYIIKKHMFVNLWKWDQSHPFSFLDAFIRNECGLPDLIVQTPHQLTYNGYDRVFGSSDKFIIRLPDNDDNYTILTAPNSSVWTTLK